MRKLYFISQAFPPLGRGGAVIAGHTARILAKEGWDIKAITDGKRKGFFLKWEYDWEFYEALKKEIEIEIIEPFQWGIVAEIAATLKLIPSLFINWAWKVNRNLDKIVEPNRDGLIMAIYPCFADLYIARKMKEKFGFPLIVNFRDDFYGNMLAPSRYKQKLIKEEKEFLSIVDFIFVTTQSVKDNLVSIHNYPSEKIEVIYNGYEKPYDIEQVRQKEDIIRIAYTGTIAKAQKPEVLNLAYRRLLEKYPELMGKVEIDIYGQDGYYYKYFLKKTIMNGISFKGFLPHYKLMNKLLNEIDVGFFSLANESVSYATPTKLFEYINLEKPILAALPRGEAWNIIEKHDIGLVSHYSDISALAENIHRLFNEPELLERFRQNIRKIKPQFDMTIQVKKMSEIMKISFSNNK